MNISPTKLIKVYIDYKFGYLQIIKKQMYMHALSTFDVKG